ncbi:MAG TPA: hypothetical protein VIM57_08610, partial [Luteolibacter sp.]
MASFSLARGEESPVDVRRTVAEAVTTQDSDRQKALVERLAEADPDEAARWLATWKEGGVFLHP